MTEKSVEKKTLEQEKNIFATHSPQKSAQDTGSPESQIANFTFRIKNLTDHLKAHRKDKNSLQRGLKKMVGKRRKLLIYLHHTDHTRYQNICQALSIKGIR